MTYSIDFRSKVLKVKQKEGLSFSEVADRFGISRAAVFRWSKNITGSNKRNRPWKKLDREALKRDIEIYPDSYSYERAQRLGVSASGIKYAKRLLGISYKKNLNHPKADPGRRSMFCQEIQQIENEGKTIVYIDASGFAHDMPRTHGYSTKGKRCYGSHDWGAKGRTNAIGALIGKMLITVALFSGSINTEVFTCWVQQDLIPKLPPKTVIVMDNATFHKGAAMHRSIAES